MKTKVLADYIIKELNKAINTLPKIDKNSDIEVLHEFRVSIRKSRSLIKLFFKKEKTIEQELKEIVTQTNTQRELDIFLISLKDKKKSQNLYSKIKLQRDKAYDKICSGEFRIESKNRLLNIIQKISNFEYFYTNKSLIKTAHKQYKESQKRFKSIDSSFSSRQLHKIRIAFKQSHYALQFIQDSKLKNENKKIRRCKKIQNYFGKIQDLTNQLDSLKAIYKNEAKNKKYLKNIKKREKKLIKAKEKLLK
jgi:CHAD domain-containing protein